MIRLYTKLKKLWWGSTKRVHPKLFELTFRYRMYIKYIISGTSGAVANLGSLAFFVEVLKFHYLSASVFSFCLGYVVSFILQKFFTFGHTSMTMVHRQLVIYLCIAVGNLLLNTVLVYVLVDVIAIWYLLSQVLASIVIAIESFVLYRRYVFTRKILH